MATKRRSGRTGAQFAELRKQIEELNGAINKLIEKQQEAVEAQAKAIRDTAEAEKNLAVQKSTAQNAATQREIQQQQIRVNNLEKESKLASGVESQLQKKQAFLEEQLELQKRQLKFNKDNAEEHEKILGDIQETEKALKDAADAQERLTKQTKEYDKAVDAMSKRFDSFSSMLKGLASGDFFSSINKGVTMLGGVVEEFARDSYSKLYAKVKTANYDMTGSLEKLTDAYKGLEGGTFGEKLKNLGSGIGKKFTGAKESIGKFFSKLKGGELSLESMGGALKNAGKAAGQMGLQYGAMTAAMGAFLAVSAAAIAALLAIAVAIGAAMILAKFTLELENSARELAKVTGLSKDFSHAMHENATQLRTMGIEAKDINAATIALSSTFTDFSMLSKSTARKITETTAVLGKLGMSADDTAKGFQTLTKGMAQTPVEAASTMIAMDALARDLGVSTSKIGADFAAAAGSLQKLSGPQALQAFKQLSVVSKATGIEISRLLAITDKFDTFEGAATQAGKLNAALGGNFVNAMELLTATNPVERFEMIRNAILDSGLAFDDMSYYQKKFYAEAAGMQDVGELALAMSGDFGAVGAEIGKTQEQYEAAAKRAKEFQSVQDQLKNSFYQLMPVITPLLEKLNEFTGVFTKYVEENKGEFQDIFGTLGLVMKDLLDIFILLAPILSHQVKMWAMWMKMGAEWAHDSFLLKGLVAIKDALTVKKSPSLLDATEIMAQNLKTINQEAKNAGDPLNKLKGTMGSLKKGMLDGEINVIQGTRMTADNIAGIGDSTAKTAAAIRTTAPVIAHSKTIRSFASHTVNNNGQSGDANINIKFDNKKMAGLFDIEVEKSVSKMARNSLIG